MLRAEIRAVGVRGVLPELPTASANITRKYTNK